MEKLMHVSRQQALHRQIEVQRLQELALHLRYCVECHQTDVLHCEEGKDLWLKAEMPIGEIRTETANLATFADGCLGCAECGAYWSNIVGIRHAKGCSAPSVGTDGG
jgi:hypothetical protein